MKSKSRKIRECLRCQYGKQVIQRMIAKKGADIPTGIYNDNCAVRVKNLTKVVHRAWKPDDIEYDVYQVYEQGILVDMFEECHAYEEMLLEMDDDNDSGADWVIRYTVKTSSMLEDLLRYSALQYKRRLVDDNDRKACDNEIEKLLPSVRRVISDFSKIKYTDQFLKYLRKKKKPKANDPEVTLSPDTCVYIELDNSATGTTNSLTDFLNIVTRVGKLPKVYRDVFWDVFDNALTSFGMNLSAVMEMKNMTANDVYMLVKPYSSNPQMRPSVIQSMMECDFPSANLELIPYIARALLVEESVLYSGVGKSWGTWAYQLDTAFIQSTVERTRGMIVQAREEVRAGIVAVIKNNDSLHEYLDEVANWEIPLYREVYAETAINLNPDRKQRLLLLRQRESLMILLSCLEARAALECSSNAPLTT